jgi:inosine/xanthosine triphosphatase
MSSRFRADEENMSETCLLNTALKIVVGSTNPVKVACVQRGFSRVFPKALLDVQGISAPSGVSDQPWSNAETLRGATNRVANAAKAHTDAEYWVGIEGGLEAIDGQLFAFAWVVIQGTHLRGQSRTATFALPQEVAVLIREGHELGDADDIVFGRNNSKQDNGSVGILTGDVIDRTSFYTEAVVLALIPFINPTLNFSSSPH